MRHWFLEIKGPDTSKKRHRAKAGLFRMQDQKAVASQGACGADVYGESG